MSKTRIYIGTVCSVTLRGALSRIYDYYLIFFRQNPNSIHTESSSSSQGTQWEALSDQSGETEERASCQRLLFEAYRNIGEPDGIYGVGIGYSSDIPTRVKAYEHEKDYGKALCKLALSCFVVLLRI